MRLTRAGAFLSVFWLLRISSI